MGNEQRSIAAKLMFSPIALQVQMFLYDERENKSINNAGGILANAQGPSKSVCARAALAPGGAKRRSFIVQHARKLGQTRLPSTKFCSTYTKHLHYCAIETVTSLSNEAQLKLLRKLQLPCADTQPRDNQIYSTRLDDYTIYNAATTHCRRLFRRRSERLLKFNTLR
jgi:hypothetical protein